MSGGSGLGAVAGALATAAAKAIAEVVPEPQYPYAVRGARIYCTCGTHTRRLDMPASHGSLIKDKPMLHEKDCKVGLDKNIPPFGACRSDKNDGIDIKISDETDLLPLADENGEQIPQEMPVKGKLCKPDLGEKWENAQQDTLVDGKAALTVACTLTCSYGGQIGFMDDGQESD